MSFRPEIVVRDVPGRDRILADIEGRIEELGSAFPYITRCRVMVEPSSRRRVHGNHCHVCLDVHVPGKEVVVRREPDDRDSHEVDVTIRDAFRTARRQLDEHEKIRRHQVKNHDR